MVRLIKAAIILALVAGIAGGAFAAYYFLYLQPARIDAADLAAAGPPGRPTPDPTTGDFERAKALKNEGKADLARQAFEDLLARYPDSTHREEAEDLLGELNISSLFSGLPGPGKSEYYVERGDVLDRVAKKTKCSAELIFQANNLERIMLQIGQKLEIPSVEFSIQIHLGPKKLLLLDHGLFFKAYAIREARSLPKKTGDIHTKVVEKIAVANSRRVTFGAKDFPGSARSLTLAGQSGFTIYGESETAGHPPGSGITLADADVQELSTLVSPGVPVVISEK